MKNNALMLKPYSRVTESVKDLPTKPTQVNSTVRLPHIRNQHVRGMDLGDKRQVAVSRSEHNTYLSQQKDYVLNPNSEETTLVKRTLPSGKEINIHVRSAINEIAKEHLDDPHIDEASLKNNAHATRKHSFGYINRDENGNFILSGDFFKDFCIDEFADMSNFDKEMEYKLDIKFESLWAEDSGRNRFNFDFNSIVDEDNEDAPSCGMSIGTSIRPEQDQVSVFFDYIGVDKHDAKQPNIGTKIQAGVVKQSKKIAERSDTSNIYLWLEAALETGPYLWPECGYMLTEASRKSYPFETDKNIKAANANNPNFDAKVFTDYQQTPEIKKLVSAFQETGDVDFIKQKRAMEYENIKGIKEAYKDPREYYKKSVEGVYTFAEFCFNIADTPETNKSLNKLNKRYTSIFGKPLPL